MKTILSLFDYTGNWPRPYLENGYNVIQVDLKLGLNVKNMSVDMYRDQNVVGILAAPPCTHFSGSGARWWSGKDKDGRTQESVVLVYKTLWIIQELKPLFWVIENPVGRIGKLIPELGYKKLTFNPCDFAGWANNPQEEAYTKKTCLWGNFNSSLVKKPVEPVLGSFMWKQYGGKSERTKELRSKTPQGFSRAFFEANKA